MMGFDKIRPALLASAAMATIGLGCAPTAYAQAPSHAAGVKATEASWGKGVWKSNGGVWFSGFASELDYLNPSKAAPNPPPLTPAAAARLMEIRRSLAEGKAIFNPTAACHPFGIPYKLAGGEFEMLFSPGRVTMLYPSGDYRRIFLDGRGHPADYDPTYYGHSIGHWEGDTLVIDTVDIRSPDTQIEPHIAKGPDMHVVERWRPVGPDKIEVAITMTDPSILTKPWAVKVSMSRTTDTELGEALCTDNNRSKPDANGVVRMLGPGGKPLPKAED
ncbi:MAG: hypothetical protein JWO72_2469 [Caulobacteraceae bacterium]|nr:hypothetical protein [Caulobacteraceae bacterium]